MRIGPVLEVTTNLKNFKYGIEIRIWSVGQDNSQSWVRISYGTVKYVIDFIQDNTEILADPEEDQVPQTSIKVVAARSKAKAKPQQREPVDTPTLTPMHERRGLILNLRTKSCFVRHLEESDQSSSTQSNSKARRRWNNSILQNLNFLFGIILHKYSIGLMIVGKLVWQQEEFRKRRYQYCSDNSGRILYLRALQGHSGNNLIDPTLQDNVVIGSGIFHYIYHIGCAFNLHSIINNGLIPGSQDLSRRQTVFFLPIDPRDKNHKDPEYIDFSVPRRARYVHSAWKRHQDAVFWVDIDLAISEGLTFYETRSNAIILQGTLPAYYISKVERLKTGEMLYERRYLSPRPPPKISVRHDHNWTQGNDQSGSTVEQQPVGKLVQQFFGEALQAGSSKPTQSKPKPICDRSGKPEDTERVFVDKNVPFPRDR